MSRIEKAVSEHAFSEKNPPTTICENSIDKLRTAVPIAEIITADSGGIFMQLFPYENDAINESRHTAKAVKIADNMNLSPLS